MNDEKFKWCINHINLISLPIQECINLLKSKNMPMYHMSWILTPEEQKIPIITARELLEAGYKVDDLGKILKILKTAKARGEVADTLQAELIWIKQKFN